MLTKVMLLHEALKRRTFGPIRKKLFQETSVQIVLTKFYYSLIYFMSLLLVYVFNDVPPSTYMY